MSLYDPRNRKEIYYKGILDGDNSLPDPQTREEIYLKAIAEAMPIITDAEVKQTTGTSATDVMSQKAVTDSLSDIDDKIDGYVNIINPDILTALTPSTGKYLDSSDGTISSNAGFFTFENIPVSTYQGKFLFPRSNDSDNYNVMRSLAFYSDNVGTFISGRSYNTTVRDNGIRVPATAMYMSICFRNEATEYHLYNEYNPVVDYALDSDIKVNVPIITDQKRNAAVCFEFDDGAVKDGDIKTIFDSYGYKCGFALISNIDSPHIVRYLGYQDAGYEILSHSTDSSGMNDPSADPSTIEAKLVNSKVALESDGFIINGFVTPNSTMAGVFKPMLRKYYQYAETEYLGAYTSGQSYMTPQTGVYNGFRVSLQTTTLENQKAALDLAVKNGGCITFYGHAAYLDTSDYLTTANLNTLLTYIKDYVDSGDIIIGTPYQVKSSYFTVRNDDVSDGWISVPYTSQNVDSRLSINAWDMKYNPKLRLFAFFGRFGPTENISGNFYLCDIPIVTGNYVLTSEQKTFILYDGHVFLTSGGSWSSGTYIRMSVICPYSKILDSLL